MPSYLQLAFKLPSCRPCSAKLPPRSQLHPNLGPTWPHLGLILTTKISISLWRGCIFQLFDDTLLKMSKMSSRWPPEAPKRPQERPKSPQGDPKTTPRGLKMAPRAAQEGPKRLLFGPRRGYNNKCSPLFCSMASKMAPRSLPDPPEEPHEGPKTPQKSPKSASREPQENPSRLPPPSLGMGWWGCAKRKEFTRR